MGELNRESQEATVFPGTRPREKKSPQKVALGYLMQKWIFAKTDFKGVTQEKIEKEKHEI